MEKLNKSRSQKNISFPHKIFFSSQTNDDKKIKLKLLNYSKPKIISTKNIKDEKQLNLIESINNFQTIYYDYCNRLESKNDLNKIIKDNNKFQKNYKEFKRIKNKEKNSDLDFYNDIKIKYKEKNIKIPKISSNIFEPNLLIIKNNNIKNYFEKDYGNETKNKKSINYLNKIKKEVDSLKYLEKGIEKNNMMDVYLKRLMKNKKSKKENFKNSSSEKEILQSTLEISKTKNTFSNLSNIDKFFQDKKKNDNNCFQFENIETSEKSYFKKLKKKKKSISKKLSIDEEKPINKFIKLFPSYFEKRLNGNTSNTKKIILKFISPLEKLYNKVSKSENKLKFNKKIKHYLKNRGLNISDHLSRKEFYDTFEQSNKNVFKKNLIYNDILLRKKNDNSLDFTEEQIKKIERDKNIKKILTDSQNQIIKMYCDYNYE